MFAFRSGNLAHGRISSSEFCVNKNKNKPSSETWNEIHDVGTIFTYKLNRIGVDRMGVHLQQKQKTLESIENQNYRIIHDVAE
jgi:hypothetical protein